MLARDMGLDVREVARELALETGVVTGPVVMNAMRRLTAPVRPRHLETPSVPALHVEPLADRGRYDSLREVHHVH